MEGEEFLDPRERDFIGIAYEVLTSKYARNGDRPMEIGAALHEMEEVKYEMMRMSSTMGLRGKVAMIFSCILVDELRKFTWSELMYYCNLFHILVPVDLIQADEDSDTASLAIIIFNEHIKRLQRMRIKRYAAAIFFGSVESRELKRPEVFHLEDDEETGLLLSEEEIRSKGVDYWFPRIGNLRSHMLAERFDFFEALYMLMLAGTLDPRDSQKKGVIPELRFKITNDMSEEDVYDELAGFYFDSHDDVRGYVTLDGVMLPYLGERDEYFTPLNDFSFINMESLVLLGKQEGIDCKLGDDFKPAVVLMFEWSVAQLGSTFISESGNHRTIMEASAFETTSSKESPFYIHSDDTVYFGNRDGMAPVVVHKLQDLCDSFVEMSDGQVYAYDPISILTNPDNTTLWLRYPRKSIVRLLEIVLQSKYRSQWALKIERKCRLLLDSTIATEECKKFQSQIIKSLKTGVRGKIQMVLIRIFNAGINLSDTEVEQEDVFSDGVMQREMNNYLLHIEEALIDAGDDGFLIRKLLLVENYNNYNVMHYEDYNYEIGNFLNILSDMVNLGLNTMTILAGRFLANTANYYSNAIFGQEINYVSFSFEETVGVVNGEDDFNESDESMLVAE